MLGYLFAYIIKKSYSPIELNMKHKLLDFILPVKVPKFLLFTWNPFNTLITFCSKKLLQLKVKDFKLDVSIKIMNDKKT